MMNADTLNQWRSYIGAFRAHALPNSLSALPQSAIILAESGIRLIVLSEQLHKSIGQCPTGALPHV